MVLVIHILQDHLHLEEVVEEDILLLELQLNLVQILVFLESRNMVMLVEIGLDLLTLVVVVVELVELAILMVLVESVEHHLYLEHQ